MLEMEIPRMRDTCYPGLRVAVVGRLAAMSRQELQKHLSERGLFLISDLSDNPDWVVFGEYDLAWADDPRIASLLDKPSPPEVIPESELWRRLGLTPDCGNTKSLFTPAMIADLVKVPVREVRRWYRLGLLTAVQVVHRLPYFDYQGLLDARRLAELWQSGIPSQRLNRVLENVCRAIPRWKKRLPQLSFVVHGETILLQSGDKLIDYRGQLQLPLVFEDDGPSKKDCETVLRIADHIAQRQEDSSLSLAEIMEMAEWMESQGNWEKAAEAYRVALAVGGPNAEVCFRLADMLYQMGDLNGARERYYMAVELDEDYIEARASLGSILVELGQTELAIAAYQGALAIYPDYADAHFLLAKLLDDLGRHEEALEHWRRFLALAPESPWASHAQGRLVLNDETPNP